MLRSRRRSSALWALCFASSLVAVGCASKVQAPPEPPVAVRLGDAAFEAEDFERAIRDYRLYLADVERGDYTARAFYKAALASFRLEDYAGTLATLDELQQRYPDGTWVQVDALRGDALRELGNPVDAVLAWDRAWNEANDIERPKLRARVAGVAAGLPRAELAVLRDEVRSKQIRALVAQEIAMRTPSMIDEPMPAAPVVADAPAESVAPAEPESPDTVVGALRELSAGSAAVPAAQAGEKDVAVPAPAEVEPLAAEAPVPAVEAEAAVAAEAEASESAEGVARLVKTERPLDPESAVVDAPAPSADEASADEASAAGVARLQRIAYPGAVDTTPPVDSLEKLDVPAAAGATP